MARITRGLEGNQRNVYTALVNLFSSYGLKDLAPSILKYVQQGFSSDTIAIELQNEPAYKRRFAANEQRLKKGLPALSPAEYISTENAYRDIMTQAGLPPGFYDRPSDFTAWLASDVSPTEVQSRVQVATDLINNTDPATLSYFKQHYSTGELVAYALDRKRAVPAIENAYKAAQVGGAAAGQGIRLGTDQADLLAKQGVSRDQAQQGFGFVSENLQSAQMLGSIYGDKVTQDDLVAEVFQNDAGATQKRKTLASKERAAFGGSSGQSKTSLTKSSAGAV